MSIYEQITKWLENNWITASILVIAAGLIALPKVRDGANLLISWIAAPFKSWRKSKAVGEIIYKVKGEVVTYAEVLRSLHQDVVKVNAHTHELGIAAEYHWIEKRYPGSKTIMQSITSLDLMKDKSKYKGSILLDKIQIRLKDGQQKDIYFDISSFFDGDSSSSIDPDGFVARKISALYKK